MTEHKPFVSGLPGVEPSPPHPRGLALLTRIRERAEQDAREMRPLCERRSDGEKYFEPDPDAIAAVEIAQATVRLVDEIMSDRDLAVPIAGRLALISDGGGRSR